MFEQVPNFAEEERENPDTQASISPETKISEKQKARDEEVEKMKNKRWNEAQEEKRNRNAA
jgi:hypothetical protein